MQKPPLFQSQFWIEKFTHKCAFTDKEFRSLRRAPKGFASGHHELFVEKQVENKFSTTKNFCFRSGEIFSLTTRPCAVGKLGAGSACRAQPEASDLRENETFKFARNRQREPGPASSWSTCLYFDFCPFSFAETGTVENTSHALVDKQRNPCTNQSPANRITKYPC